MNEHPIVILLSVALGALGQRLFVQFRSKGKSRAAAELDDVAAILERLDGIEASVRRLWQARRRIE